MRHIFTTPFIPNCKTPIIDGEYGASNITYNTATLTWRQPGDQPMFWTVRYADADFNPATATADQYTELTVTSAQANLTGLVAGTTYYVYIKATCSTSPLDESPWLSMSNAAPAYTFTTPTCVTPTAVAATDVTNSTAMIHWTSNATAWTVKYGPAGFDPDNEGIAVAATADSIELTGLDAYINYEVYVKANCTATDESDWSAAATFRTVCPDGGDVVLDNGDQGQQYYIPADNYYKYTYSQQIITAEELGAAKTLYGIKLNYAYASAMTNKTDVVMYLGYTDKASFASTTDWVEASALTEVYSGSLNCEQGWNEFTFTTPFEYNGTGNLVLVVDDNSNAYDGSSYKYYTRSTTDYMTLYYHNDNINPDPENPPTASSRVQYRNDMVFVSTCNTDVTCFAPASISATVTPANVVTLNWAPRTDLRPVVNNYQVKYGLEGFNPETQGTLIDNLNGVTTTTINGGLGAEQNYDVYVRTACGGGDYSKWTRGTFVTYPTCWAPVNVTVTATTSNSATLTWANDSIAPTAVNRWEVAYGLEGFNPNDVAPIETTNNTAFEVTGLRHSSKYEFYVRSKCSADDLSPWSAVATGTTQCGVWQYGDMPLTENFDGVTGTTSSTVAYHVLPNCWDYLNAASSATASYSGYPIAYNGASYSHSGNNHMRFYTYTTAAYADQYAILPQFGFDLDTLVVGFYARESSTTSSYVGKVVVGVMTDPADASTFVAVDTVLPTTTGYEYFEVNFEGFEGTGRYIALKAPKPTSGYNIVYLDDLTVKLREKVNVLPNNGGAMTICQEFVQLDTVNGTYANGLNATYVIRPAEAGKVAHINGSYDLEYGYDFIYVYRGEGANKVIVDTLTGSGDYDFMPETNDWVNYGAITLVMKSDADNALPYSGFKFIATCDCPAPAVDMPVETVEVNGSYTWTAGNGETYLNHATTSYANDRVENIDYTFTNVAGCDSVYRHLALTIHPDYTLNYAATICERDEYEFYGQTFTTAGTYNVTLQSVYGADSTGILALTVNSAPSASIQYNNRTVTSVANMCDNYDMTLNARSNVANATFLWEDSSTAALRVVNPHESNTYTVVAINPATGCTSVPASVTVTTTPVPALTISGDSEICYGQSATLTLTDANEVPATYRWSNNSTATSITVSPATTTTYSVTATSTTGACVATAEFTVTVNALPVVEVAAAPAVICQNDIISLTATNVEGYSYNWNTGAETSEATIAAAFTGNFTVTVTDQNGCVNEFTTNNVTVNPVYDMNDEQSACVGMLPYTWGANTLQRAGSYEQTFQTIKGCDSTVHLTFIVQDTANSTVNRELCEGTHFTFGNGIYELPYIATENTVISYVDTTSGECPARYNLNLTVNTHNPATVENTVCDSYVWPLTGETYNQSGAYQTMLQTTKGCDSLVTLNLTVNYQNTGVDEQTACDSYEWIDGNIYTANNNTATYTLNNEFGCDSVVTLNLTVNYRSYHEDFRRVCDAKTFTWDDNDVYDLDVELADSIQHVTGENIFGCLEIALLHLDLNYVSDTVRQTVNACDEYVIDTVACDNSIETAYLRESGVYTLRVHNDSLDRDEMLILDLTVNTSTHHTNVVNSCLPYTWVVSTADTTYEVATITSDMVNGASVYTMSYDMAELGITASSCSQIEVLRLTPNYPTEEVVEATICQNGTWYSADSSVSYNGADLNVGLNTMTWKTSTNAEGCQHLHKVALTVNPVVADTVNLTYCESQFIYTDTVNNEAYLNYVEGNDTLRLTIPATGLNETVYTNTVEANWETEAGCGRTVTVNYTVNPVISETDTVKAFLQYVWDANDKLYEGVGHYNDIYWYTDPVTGCRASRVLDLEISDYIRLYDTIIVCTQYELDGKTYYEDNTFEEQLNENTIQYTTYHVTQRTLTDVNIVTNQPYTWINGETYTANASNVYYSVPAAVQGECDDVYRLTLTMTAPISICEGQLPYTTAYGFVIDAAENGVYTSITTDTIIAYTVKLNTSNAINETACDSYTWHGNTYTEGGSYNFDTVNAAGCDSTVTLNLTINASTTGTVDVTVCDSYTWHGTTYSQSGSYTFDTVNAAGCDSTATLTLVINKNNGVTETVTACDSYTWNGVTYTADANVTKTFNDVNGCAGDSVLNLTVNYSVSSYPEMIVNEASTIYMGRLYNAPFDEVVSDTLKNSAANGCDSIVNMHLQLNTGLIITEDTVSCGDFTWRDGNTYTWIPMAQRTNPVFNYAKITETGLVPVEDFPVYETYSNGIVVNTYVLHLTMVEARTEYKEVTVLLSNDTYTDPLDNTNHVFDFTAEKAAGQNATKLDTIHYGGIYYCDSIVYYTFNLVYNYVDDDTVTVCNSVDSYTTANGAVVALAEGINVFTDTTAAGTANEMVHNMVYVRSTAITGTETITACDSAMWNNTRYTANVVDEQVSLTAANGCDSVVTLNVTIVPTVHNVITPADVCDSYTWTNGDGVTYTNDTVAIWRHANVTNGMCTDVDTLKLVLKHSTMGTDTQVACDSYEWIDGNTYTASNNTATETLTNAAGCDSVVTLNLTINNSFNGAGNDIDTLGASITLTDKNGSYLFLAPYSGDTTLVYQTVAGCDSIVTFHITVNQFQIIAENKIECGMYTWNEAGHGTGHTYKWISDAEKTAYAINIPGVSPMLPLYKDVTTGNYIYNRPMDTVGNTVYMLNLNLNEALFVDSTIALFPQSVETLTLHGETFNFAGMTSASKPTADTSVTIMLQNDNLCGTWMTYNVHVVYNYRSDSETLCYTDSYTWEDGQTETLSVGSQTIIKTLYADNWDSLRVVTRTITVRANNNTYEFDQEVCDSYTWNDSVYTTSGSYTQNFTDQYGCDSVATLNLTVKYNTSSVETLAGCDSVMWHGTWYYASNDTATYAYTAGNGCQSVDTLNLTINHNEPQVDTVSACVDYFWATGGRSYSASGVYTAIRTDGNTCQAVDTLLLTINMSNSYDSALYVTDGSYLYMGQNNTPTLIMSGDVATFTEHYTNVAGCDSILNIEIHVGAGYFVAEDTTSCNSFTWRDGNTYVWISSEERAAHGNALYKNETTGEYVMSNPIYNAANEGDYDSIFMLRLNLTQNYTYDTTINFPISLGTLTYGDSTFNFTTINDEGREFVNTIVEREVHFASDYYCDSIHHLTINLQNNYSEVTADAADICVTQSSYAWRNHTINTATTDFDHAHTYYIYDTVGTAEAPVVEYIKVTQHPVVYATERRTACDSYTWNGTVYTESTSGATFDTVDMWGCDSTVTLLLTINHNSSSAEETTVCDTYTWTAGNGQSYTYTESGVYLSDVYLTNKGCESRDTLRLTVNNTTNNAYTVDECGSYTWHNTEYDQSGDYTYSYDNSANCPSVDTLHLTIRNTTNQGYTQVACDSYEWHDSTYLESTTAYYEYANGNGCVSVDTLYLTINASTTATVYDTVCDSYNWQTGDGNTYIQSGTYVWHTTNGNNCTHDVSLHLTVNNSTHNSESAVACDTYTWHNTEYTTGGVKTYEYNNGFCASVDTLHLTLYHSDYDGVNYANQTVNDWCGDYTWIVNDSVVGVYTESVETSTRITSPVTTCDSIIFLNLTIKNAPVIDTAATVCENTLPYTWRGIEMNEAGVETVAFPLENGCDSTIRFTLTVNPKYDTALMANICLGSGFEGYNFNIPAEQLNTLGEHVFVDSLTSVNGCDSIVTLTVNVKTYYNTTVEYTACDEFLWDLNGETYNESGNYNHTIIAVNNCDSVVTLALTINKSTTGVDEQTACNRYTWIDGETYTASNNTATFTMENAAGCDSVITLDLTVNYSNNYEFTDVACDVYTWNGATYSQSGDYTYAGTNMDGCDSVVTMHLTVNNSTTSVITDEACESYTWETGNGQTYTESGNYTFAIVNGNAIGCDSVITLALNIKKATRGIDVQTACENFTWIDGETYYASNDEATYTLENAAGCDSVVTLNLTINYATHGTDKQSACESFTWIDGETYYASNDEATYTLTGANGCDSVVTLDLTINTPSTGIDVQTACDTYTWMDGNVYTASNNEATYTLANADMNGCDSIVTLNLTINNSTTSSEVAATCGEFEWHGQSYSQNGLYRFDTINAVGCDSTVYLSLVVNQSISTTSEATACDSYEWNGETYTESGVYTFTSQTDGGCESIATLLLTIKKSTNNAENVTVCDNYTWNNTQYSTSGDYTYSYTNAAGCASTDTLHLTINASTTETVNATACDSYTWQNGNGNTYLQSGTYTWNTTNANNCNHVVTLNLTINNATSSTVTETACNSFVWNGQTYTETGVYTWHGTNAANCDSVATLMLMINQPYASSVERTACESYTWTTGNGQTYTQSGNYDYTTTALNGCDSVVTLVLTINTPANTTETLTACDSLTWLNGNGQLYTESGVYTYNFTDNNGCQATSTLNLTINQHVDTYAEAEDCSSYTWSVTGETYTESGVYTAAITDGNNCAATAHLTLAINGGTSELMTVTACDAFTWTEGNGQTYTETPAYSVSYNTLNAHGCPHVIYLDLTINHSDTVVIPVTAVGSYTWNDTTLTSSGTYFYNTTNVAGCDSIVTLLLTIEQPVVKYYVTLLSDNASMGVVSGSANDSVVENTVFTATATANDGYQFVYWMSNTGDVITENPYSFQVTSDMTLTAYFEAVLVNYTVSASTYTVIAPGDTLIDQQGSIIGTGVYESGTTATLTAQADSGYHFLYWSNGLSTATITFTVTGDIELIAYFEKDAEPQAVEVADMDNVVIFSNDTRIIVRGAEGHDVTVFDVNGRMISRKLNAADEVEFRMAATGVYLVKVGNAPAKRVLVVR